MLYAVCGLLLFARQTLTLARTRSNADFHTLLENKVGRYSEVFKVDGHPKPFIKFVADLAEYVRETQQMANLKTKFTTGNYRALQQFKTTIRRYTKTIQSEIDAYERNPDGFLNDTEAPAAAAVVDDCTPSACTHSLRLSPVLCTRSLARTCRRL